MFTSGIFVDFYYLVWLFLNYLLCHLKIDLIKMVMMVMIITI